DVVSVVSQPPSWPAAKWNRVAVRDCDERVSARNVLKHDGTVLPTPSNASVRLMPPSKKSGGTTVCPTLVPFEVSHSVVMFWFHGFGPEFVVAQMESDGSPAASGLQSPPLPIGKPSHAAGFSGLSMQSSSPS